MTRFRSGMTTMTHHREEVSSLHQSTEGSSGACVYQTNAVDPSCMIPDIWRTLVIRFPHDAAQCGNVQQPWRTLGCIKLQVHILFASDTQMQEKCPNIKLLLCSAVKV